MTVKKLKMPYRTAKVELDGAFEGWWFLARTNPPIRAISDMYSGNFDRMVRGLSEIVLDWNFVDEEGNNLGSIKNANAVRKEFKAAKTYSQDDDPVAMLLGEIPSDLILKMVKVADAEIGKMGED